MQGGTPEYYGVQFMHGVAWVLRGIAGYLQERAARNSGI